MTYSFIFHENRDKFSQLAEDYFERAGAKAHLIQGIFAHQQDGELLYSISKDECVVAIAIRTPPWKMIISEIPDDAINAFVDFVFEKDSSLDAFQGPEHSAEAFAKAWQTRIGSSFAKCGGMLWYELHKLISPRPCDGEMVDATEDDIPLLADWIQNFMNDVDTEFHVDPHEMAKQDFVHSKFWSIDGDHRAMSIGSIRAGCRDSGRGHIGMVYTPPKFRGQGLASNLVAQQSQRLLDQCANSVILAAEAVNKTSNAIYQRIGYRHYDTHLEYKISNVS